MGVIEKEEEEEDEAIVTASRWLASALRNRTGVSQKHNEKSEYHSQCWAESISKGFKKLFIIYLCQEPFLFATKKKKLNNFEYISRHNFSANQK